MSDPDVVVECLQAVGFLRKEVARLEDNLQAVWQLRSAYIEQIRSQAAELDRVEAERDTYLAHVRALVHSMFPHPDEHPSMFKAWMAAQATLDSFTPTPTGEKESAS